MTSVSSTHSNDGAAKNSTGWLTKAYFTAKAYSRKKKIGNFAWGTAHL